METTKKAQIKKGSVIHTIDDATIAKINMWVSVNGEYTDAFGDRCIWWWYSQGRQSKKTKRWTKVDNVIKYKEV